MNNSKYIEYLDSQSKATKKVVCSSNPNLKLTVLTEQTIKNIESLNIVSFKRDVYYVGDPRNICNSCKSYICIYENDKLLGCSN